ncbi:MAG: Autotransporter adhesin [Myxococcales bacterium]|nr:Autotransporter adhesin [Myxococcales bacterium]
MRLSWLVAVACAASACGRIGFEPPTTDGGGAPVISPYARAVLADHPVAYLRFDEPSGPTVASLVGNVTGTCDTITFGSASAVGDGSSVGFDGQASRISLGDVFPFVGTSHYSFEIWINPAELGSTRFVIDRRTSTAAAEGYSMYLGDTYFLFARRSNNTEFGYVSVGGPPIHAWMHVVTTYDGAIPSLYIDNVLVADNQGSGAAPIGSGLGELVIGDKSSGQFFKFSGLLDELAIYDEALTPSQIATHFHASGR